MADYMDTDQAFLGSGMKFPPQANKATGRFVLSTAERSVKESIYLILTTTSGERFRAPHFGSQLSRYAFMDVTITNLSMMQHELQRIILAQEPRIADVDIRIDSESRDDCLIVNISYRVAYTNTVDNLVFPFYLKAVPEGGVK
jgi:phage baseplate assembly protein W